MYTKAVARRTSRRVGLFSSLLTRKSAILVALGSALLISYKTPIQHYYYSTLTSPKMTSTTKAPLHDAKFTPPQQAPSWDWDAKTLLSDTESLIANLTRSYDELAAIESPTVDNFVKPFMYEENRVASLSNQLSFLQHVSADQSVRDASVKATELLQNFDIESSMRVDLYNQFEKVWQLISDQGPKYESGVNPEDKLEFELFKFVEKCRRDYRRAGMNLPEETRAKIKEVKKKISTNSLNFSQNLGEQKEFIAFTKEQLIGVSDDTMDQFERFTSEETGEEMYKVTFKYPDIFPVMRTAKSPDTRKAALTAYENRVSQNEPILRETLILRNELAKLLGYPTYASYNLELKMAKDEETARNFVEDLKRQLQPLGKKEIENLKQLKEQEYKEMGLAYDDRYYSWDHNYYAYKYLKENFNVDLERIAEYYPLNTTITGMLDIYEKVLKLKFIEEKDPAKKTVWHPDVQQIAVWKMDNPDQPEFVGWIYFDLHPRDGKYGHAANFGIVPSYVDENGKRIYPVTTLVCNFSKSTEKKPSLLKHNEITTFFHELGHGIHDLVSRNLIGRFNGPMAVPWDFVEAPSQMLEFWTWNKDELMSLSRHYRTNEKIPGKLLDSLIATKHVNGALAALRQLFFGIFDLTVHTDKHPENIDLLALWNNLREQVTLIENDGISTRGYASFGHIMSDSYSAGYYGYMWAEVFAADMYHTKFAADPLNSAVGTKYRDIVLANGGGLYEIKDKLTEFLGREPNNKAFLKEIGIEKQ